MSECQYHQRKAKEDSIKIYMQKLEKWYRQTYLQHRNKDADLENGHAHTGARRGGQDKLGDQD